MTRYFSLLLFCMVLFAIVSAPTLGAAQTVSTKATGPIQDVSIGFDGVYTAGFWTRMLIDLKAGDQELDAELQVTIPDSDGVLVTTTRPVSVAAGETSRVPVYVRFGRVRSSVEIALVKEGEAAITKSFSSGDLPVARSALGQLVVTVGPEIGFRLLAEKQRRKPAEEIAAATVVDLQWLPEDWRAYEGVSLLVLTTRDKTLWKNVKRTQWDAIIKWVHLGGRLLLSVGEHGDELLGERGPLVSLAPGKFRAVNHDLAVSGLEEYIAAPSTLEEYGDVAWVQFDQPLGDAIVFSEEGVEEDPLVMRHAVGLGDVLFFAFDLDDPFFAKWEHRQKLLEDTNEELLLVDQHEESGGGQVSFIGYDDLSGQLRGALDRFPEVTIIPFSWVAALLVFYMFLIGPGDYFFLRRFLKRMELTWVTFPLIIVGMCVLAYYLAETMKGQQMYVNQAEIVDYDLATGTLRGTGWGHVFSPENETYNLTLHADNSDLTTEGDSQRLLTWQGLPGPGFGGMDVNSSLGLSEQRYWNVPHQEGELVSTSITQLPISKWATRSITWRWNAQGKAVTPSQLTSTNFVELSGEFSNPLNIELEDCLLIYNDRAARLYQLDSIAAGQLVDLSDFADSRNFGPLLRRKMRNATDERSTAWDRTSVSVPDILRMMMFHEVADGRRHTKLLNRYQQHLDFKHLLRNDRAILLGRARSRATELYRDGEPLDVSDRNSWTYYRIVLPVTFEP